MGAEKQDRVSTNGLESAVAEVILGRCRVAAS